MKLSGSLGGVSRLVSIASLALLGSACAVGKGEGEVKSDLLFSEGCVNGPFDLRPDFFASNPHLDTQMITVQHGDKMQDLADGVLISVQEVSTIIDSMLGQPISVTLPPGVNPPGHVPRGEEGGLVAMTLYLNDSCHEQDVSLQAVSGSITFFELFSGDLKDRKKSERLIEAEFDVTVGDPRLFPADGSEPEASLLSRVTGDFRFYFRRGQPAQPFP